MFVQLSNQTAVHDNLVFFWMHNHADPMTWDMDGEEQFVVAENVDGICVYICNGHVVMHSPSFGQCMKCVEKKWHLDFLCLLDF